VLADRIRHLIAPKPAPNHGRSPTYCVFVYVSCVKVVSLSGAPGYLLEQVRLNGENRELKDEIIQLGTRYGIVTPYTSFLVTEDMKDVGRRNIPIEDRRALESMRAAPGMGQGTGALSTHGRETITVTGESAVAYSKAENKMKGLDKIESPESYFTSVRTVGEKTFQMKGEEWIDTVANDSSSLPKVEVQFGSEEFFNLISKEPKLAEFFSLGKKVTVVFKGRIYRVTG